MKRLPWLALLALLSPPVTGEPAETPVETAGQDRDVRASEPAQEEEAEGIRRSGLPEGFGEWEEPQTTAADVYYGGQYRLTTLVEYTLEELRFLNPEEAARAVPTAREPDTLAEQLSGTLDTHGELVCAGPDDAGCGLLEPDDAGVIFDETRFRVDVFVHPSLLSEPERERQYLPPPEHPETTLVQNLSATHSASSVADNRFSLFGRTRVGRGSGHGFANWVSTDHQSFSMDEGGYHHDFLDHQATVGLFEPGVDALRALRRQPLLGVGVARSMKSRRDRDAVISSPIELFLPQRSRVDIFRDDRLVSSGFYEAGNQELETTRLPAGAYEVELVITDMDGNVRTERQLFVKSTVVAPPGEALWFADAGRVMQRNPREAVPDRIDEYLGRAGYRWRQQQWLGLGVAGAATTEAGLGEASAHFLYPGLQAGGEIFSSSEGGWGYGLRGTGRWRDLVASLSIRRTHADDFPDPDDEDGEAPYRLLPTEQSLRTLQLSQRLGDGQLLATGSEARRPGGERTRRASLRYRHTLRLGGGQSLTLSSEVGSNDGDRRILAGVQWRMHQNHWTHSANLQGRDSRVEGEVDGVSGGVATSWRDGERFVDDVEAGLRADADREQNSLGGHVQHRSQYGRGRFAASAVDGPSSRRALASSTYDTSILVGEDITPGVGGASLGESGLLLDLTDIPDGLFDVIVNGQRQFTARGGRRVALTLPPYEEYRVRLADRGLDMVRFDEEPREVTLYPGNVVTMKWELRRVNVLVARLVRQEEICLAHIDECYNVRAALGDARIEGVEGFAFSDPDGYFQADVRQGVEELVAHHPEGTCRVSLADLTPEHGVLRAGNLLCLEEGEEPPAPEADEPEPDEIPEDVPGELSEEELEQF